ncbi:MAG: hypothetical protein NT170_02285 [Candidatus Moranbacteria bacterium]|nr:hypothetical protein [Candidatus Moranbacteria bacterium]
MKQKQYIIAAIFFLLVAAVLVCVVFWRSSPKEISAKKEQSVDSQNVQSADSPAPTSDQGNQAGQTNQADQIASIDKSAQESLGGDYKVDGASFVAESKEENGVKVQVGDKSARVVLPELTLSRWDETKMTLKPNLDGIAARDKTVSFEKDKIKFDTPKIGYSLENLPASQERPEGGFEYDIVLKEKPATNVVSLGIETENLDFFYQPALTPEEIAQGSQRPENVVGSYAVYYKGGRSGDYSALGGKNYMTGKAFHIFRPKIEDATGNWVWGDLHIDEKAGLLTVTIPQDFLDKAVYPVTHAAGLEFGYDHIGVTPGNNANSIFLMRSAAGDSAPALPTNNGALYSILAYCKNYSGSNNLNPALYANLVTNKPGARLAYLNSGGSAMGVAAAWVETLATGTLVYGNLISGTKYWIGMGDPGGTGAFTIYYDASSTIGDTYYWTRRNWPNPYGEPAQIQRHYSVYVKYKTPIYIRKNVNFKTNVNFK